MLKLLPEEQKLSVVEVEQLLEEIVGIDLKIAEAQRRLNELSDYYQSKIERAQEIFESETKPLNEQKEYLKMRLERYAKTKITDKRRSLQFPSGILSFRKQQPVFYIGDVKVTNDNPAVIELARRIDSKLVKTTETADWAALKTRLKVESEQVYVEETGEVIPDMRAQILPDKFTVKAV